MQEVYVQKQNNKQTEKNNSILQSELTAGGSGAIFPVLSLFCHFWLLICQIREPEAL